VVLADVAKREPVWILAPPENWPDPWASRLLQPVGDVVWPFHAHAPLLEGDNLTLFDNGNYRVSPWTGAGAEPEEQTWSRVVSFQVDEAAGTVSQRWSLDATTAGELFSKATGWVERTPGGLLAVTWGVVQTVDGVAIEDLGLSSPAIHLALVDDSGPSPIIVQETRVALDKPGQVGFMGTRGRPMTGPYPSSVATVTWE
jgi:hypothetical protein